MSPTPIPSPGDILSRTRLPVTHYGTVVGPQQVLDIVPGGPPRVVSLEQFADGCPITLRRPRPHDVPERLARARQIAESHRLYDLLAFNCEHLKNLIATGKAQSETVQLIGLAAMAFVIVVLVRGRGH